MATQPTKSIRIPENVHAQAKKVSGVMFRSISQQITYWADLGQALLKTGLNGHQIGLLLSGKVKKVTFELIDD